MRNAHSIVSIPDNFRALMPTLIGFDRLIAEAEKYDLFGTPAAFPPYNIIRDSEDSVSIEIALAGIDPSRINVEQDKNILNISVDAPDKDPENEGASYVHRGIANRQFRRSFRLADYVDAVSAEMVNGILKIGFKQRIPEEMKPRQIKIG